MSANPASALCAGAVVATVAVTTDRVSRHADDWRCVATASGDGYVE
jgi:hypothetical protein